MTVQDDPRPRDDLNLKGQLANSPGMWRPAKPAEAAAIAELVAAAPLTLPRSYLELLALSNGGEGDLAVAPGWISFWPVEDVVALNEGYEMGRYAPGMWGFGSNGGGELIAFDYRSGPPYPVVAIPFIPLDPAESISLAPSFEVLAEGIGRQMSAS